MTTILAQIAPQRNSLYSSLAEFLAPRELELSPLRGGVSDNRLITLGGQKYLRFEMATLPDDRELYELGALSALKGCFVCHDRLGGYEGPFLHPIEAGFQPAFPPDFIESRRYKGKTNELFTHFLCNVARFSSAFSGHPWGELSVLDPLSGGGTTLLTALALGADAAGVEKDMESVRSTETFVKQYCEEKRIRYTLREERLRGVGYSSSFCMEGEAPRRLVLARGETSQANRLIGNFKPHLIVADLPYGFQHGGPLVSLLEEGLPAWASMLRPGGAVVFSWDATRFPRVEMVRIVRAMGMRVLDGPPYNALAHRVDRAIKQRDVLVALPVRDVDP